MRLHSYPSIYNIGHRAIQDLFTVPVLVEEKIDGSQFSFGVDENGELSARSKGAQLQIEAPERMFAAGIGAIKELRDRLKPGWTYRGEYLQKPKHNSLAYDRIPHQHVILFDVNTGDECYLTYRDKAFEAERLGLEVVPLVYEGMVSSVEMFRSFLDRVSVLGGQKVEGVVVKQYQLFGADKKALMGKFVSEAFREIHAKEWKDSNPTGKDIIEMLGAEYRTPARWAKAVQHLRESGLLESSPRDIGALMKEVPRDVRAECESEIKEKLWRWAWPHIQRKISAGLPEWYKDELLKGQFEDSAA